MRCRYEYMSHLPRAISLHHTSHIHIIPASPDIERRSITSTSLLSTCHIDIYMSQHICIIHSNLHHTSISRIYIIYPHLHFSIYPHLHFSIYLHHTSCLHAIYLHDTSRYIYMTHAIYLHDTSRYI